jgi:acyl-CoA reductase-like NAD-dependent aldehyde dehydrogenase
MATPRKQESWRGSSSRAVSPPWRPRALLVDESIFRDFVARIADRVRGVSLGNPLDARTQMGPIATAPQLTHGTSPVDQPRADGPVVPAGERRAELSAIPDGLFYKHPVLAGVGPMGSIWYVEVFGPVRTAMRFRDEREAIRAAGSTASGLAAGLWTSQLKRTHRMAGALQAGTVWIHMHRALAYNARFGGDEAPGVGRENGFHAIDEYLRTNTVWFNLADEVQDPFVLDV